MKAFTLLSGGGLIFGAITENSLISITAAAAIIGVVFKAGLELQGIRDWLKDHDKRFDKIEDKIEKTANADRSASQMDMDMFRAEMRPVLKDAAPEIRPWIASTKQRFRVLILEDNEQDMMLFKRMLSANFEVDNATTLSVGCQKLQAGIYDCVLLDLGLPDLKREEAVASFVAKHPTALCIAMSGAEGMESIALKQGADAFLSKDALLDPAYVQRMINHAIIRFKSRNI